MRGVIMKIGVNREVTTTRVNGAPKYEMLKEGIDDGYLELVPYFTTIEYEGKVVRCVAFCDEYGKQNNLPRNDLANGLWDLALARLKTTRLDPAGREMDFLVGPIVVTFGDDEWMETL